MKRTLVSLVIGLSLAVATSNGARAQELLKVQISVVSVHKTETGKPFRYSIQFSNGFRADGQVWPGDTPKLEELLLSAREGDNVELTQLRGAPLACSDQAATEHGLGIWAIKLGDLVARDILTLTGTQRLCGGMGNDGMRFPERSEMSEEEQADIVVRQRLLEENN
ncbi:MAG: hypothetical protein VW236_08245 [Flavobacteriaceae bacterium]